MIDESLIKEATRAEAASKVIDAVLQQARQSSSEVKTGGDKLKDLLGHYTKFAFDNEQEFIEKFFYGFGSSSTMPGGYHLTPGEFYMGEHKIMFELNNKFGGSWIDIDTQEYIDWVGAR